MDLSLQIALTCLVIGLFFLVIHYVLDQLDLEERSGLQFAAVTFCAFIFASLISFIVWLMSRIWGF